MFINNKTAKPWLVAAKERVEGKSGGWDLDNVNLRVLNETKGLLEATNGKAMVEIPVDLSEGDTAGLIPAALLKDAQPMVRGHVPEIQANGQVEVLTKSGKVTLKRCTGDFPPGVSDILDKACATSGKLSVTLDARLLLAIQNAMGAESITLLLKAPTTFLGPDAAWADHSDGSRHWIGGVIGCPYGSEDPVPGRAAIAPFTVGWGG